MPDPQVEYLTPKFRPDELICKDAPRGQLPYTAPAGIVSKRITANDEAGEDCRQKLTRARLKIEVTNEIVEAINAGKKPKR